MVHPHDVRAGRQAQHSCMHDSAGIQTGRRATCVGRPATCVLGVLECFCPDVARGLRVQVRRLEDQIRNLQREITLPGQEAACLSAQLSNPSSSSPCALHPGFLLALCSSSMSHTPIMSAGEDSVLKSHKEVKCGSPGGKGALEPIQGKEHGRCVRWVLRCDS